MLIRPPLNNREPRTMRECRRDPFDFIEHHRAPLADRLARLWLPVSYLVAAGVAVALLALWGWK